MDSNEIGSGRIIIRCLFSHKCGRGNHTIGELTREIFRRHGIEVLIDPFEKGVEVWTRIEVLDIHALLFLSCKESLKSRACQKELEVARAKSIPIFVIRRDDELPGELSSRIYLDIEASSGDLKTELDVLAETVLARATLYWRIQSLREDGPPDKARDNAQAICDENDHTAVAEFIVLLDTVYRLGLDPTARYWLALAIGKTRCTRGVDVLEKWHLRENHQLPKEGIKEALAMIGSNSKSTRTKNRNGNRALAIIGILFVAALCFVWAESCRIHQKLKEVNQEIIKIEELQEKLIEMASEIKTIMVDGT